MNEFIKNIGIFLIVVIVGGIMVMLFYDGLHYIGMGVRQIGVPDTNPFETIIKGITSLATLAVPWLCFKVHSLSKQIEKQSDKSNRNCTKI